MRTTARIATLWQRSRPVMLKRIALLERAARELSADALTPELREEALDVAHKLAGSLGMFGFPEGTTIAQELELRLEAGGDADAARVATLVAGMRKVLFPGE